MGLLPRRLVMRCWAEKARGALGGAYSPGMSSNVVGRGGLAESRALNT